MRLLRNHNFLCGLHSTLMLFEIMLWSCVDCILKHPPRRVYWEKRVKNNIQSTVITTFWHCNLSFVANPFVKRYLQRVSDGLRAISIVLMLLMMYEPLPLPKYMNTRTRCPVGTSSVGYGVKAWRQHARCLVVSPPENRPASMATMFRWWIIGVEFNPHTMDRLDWSSMVDVARNTLNNNVLLCTINNNKHQLARG